MVGVWLTQYGEDTLDEWRGKPALIAEANPKIPDSYPVAFGRGPITRKDLARFRLSRDEATLFNLVNSYNGARAEFLTAEITLTGQRSKLRVEDIVVRHRNRQPEPLTGGYVLKTTQGADSSPQILVNLDLREPLFELKDKPGTRYFDTAKVSLERGEVFTFQVDFVANIGYHEFDLELTYLFDGKKEKLVIAGPDLGVFKLSGRAEDYRAYGGEVYLFSDGAGGARMTPEQACETFDKSQGC